MKASRISLEGTTDDVVINRCTDLMAIERAGYKQIDPANT